MISIIRYTFYALITLIPLTFTTFTSELFEFPKYLLLITATIIVAGIWISDSWTNKDWSLPSTPLNIPIITFLASQLISTIFSIHPYTSFWGYYSRYHQGLLTTICYTILYFAFVKYMDTRSVRKFFLISIATSIIVSIYAILQHFGIDKNVWIQDVQNRVFSTLGQPNWLAAYLIPNIFLILYFQLSNKKLNPLFYYPGTFLLTTALLFTKSRSGILALGLTLVLSYLFIYLKYKKEHLKTLGINAAIIIVLSLAIGTPWTPMAKTLFSSTEPIPTPVVVNAGGTELEVGGSKSTEIRKIVWNGALDLFRSHPLIGTGVETFAYSYYWTRPIDHNYVSEWDFLYNKAHNEYLNFAANSGALGLLTHLAFFAFFAFFLFTNKSLKKSDTPRLSLLAIFAGAGLASIGVTNFFGFSVIPVTLLMYLLPASLFVPKKSDVSSPGINWTTIATIAVLIYLLPIRMLIADWNFAKGKSLQLLGQHIEAANYLEKAADMRPSNSLFHSQYAESLSELTTLTSTSDNPAISERSADYLSLTLDELNRSKELNSVHLNLFKSRAKSYLALAEYDTTFHEQAAIEIEEALALTPTDAKLAYNLGLIYSRLARNDDAVRALELSISLKRDYIQPYYALTLMYETTKQTDKIPPLLEQAVKELPALPNELQQKIDEYLN